MHVNSHAVLARLKNSAFVVHVILLNTSAVQQP